MESRSLRSRDDWHLLPRVGNAILSFVAVVTSPWGIRRESVVALAVVTACLVHLAATGRLDAWAHPRPVAGPLTSVGSAANVSPGSQSVKTAIPQAPNLPASVLTGQTPLPTAATIGVQQLATSDPVERVPFSARRKPATAPLAESLASTPVTGSTQASSVNGSAVAARASTLVGDPYAWGGTSPAGFDCSGLVWYVFQQVGVQLPRDLPGQLASGVRVARDDLQPGDIVFFVNTYQPGLSHSGIYLGGGRFVSAIDEATGVAISNLSSPYWVSRYYAAIRPR